ncbi:sulfurtransferase [Acinetobacter rathckeae]|uniref:sulfurtransferase n=1 Tax=Acinetobacter rathckeae TaxID=2605272 RepID=UPI0018A257F1|nr:rhodanese-like domain-containing protein [Acinetobacter rathckeae]MBF7695284.1 sulfurtransferase [Acinetobacter rathckeae]
MTCCDLSLDSLIDAEQLLPHLDHSKLRIVDLTRASVYRQLHLPNAVHVMPKQLVAQHDFATGKLPDQAKLQALIEYLNLSPEHHVVAYDDEGGAWASRLLWNLHCAGFQRTSLLNGGIHAWLAKKYPVTTVVPEIDPVSHFYQVCLDGCQSHQIDYEILKQAVEKKQIQVWDCRSFDEYTGQQRAARKGGHIPNALHYAFDDALDRENHLKLQPLAKIRQNLQDIGFDLDQPVVVYCQSHHRSGLAYVIARVLQWQVRAYDGAWSEWGNMTNSPIVMGEKPL